MTTLKDGADYGVGVLGPRNSWSGSHQRWEDRRSVVPGLFQLSSFPFLFLCNVPYGTSVLHLLYNT